MYKSRNLDCRVGNCFEGPQLNDLVRTCDYNDTGTNDDNDLEIHREAQALLDIIQAEALQDDGTGNNLSTGPECHKCGRRTNSGHGQLQCTQTFKC